MENMEKLEKIAVLNDEMQAQLLEAVLTDRGIPHVLRTYHDSAYDGLFQTQKGWGVVLAAPEHRAEILAVIADLERPSEFMPEE
ncbi:MAG: hypothetical protein ACYDIE_01970 [Candidatus Krumholzibacteriia bacterium]